MMVQKKPFKKRRKKKLNESTEQNWQSDLGGYEEKMKCFTSQGYNQQVKQCPKTKKTNQSSHHVNDVSLYAEANLIQDATYRAEETTGLIFSVTRITFTDMYTSQQGGLNLASSDACTDLAGRETATHSQKNRTTLL